MLKSHSAPILFYKPQTSLIGPEAPITIPKAAQPVEKHLPDYEVELTVVIGKPAKDVSEADALDYVLGYVTGNDVRFAFILSVREVIIPFFHRCLSGFTRCLSRSGDFPKGLVCNYHLFAHTYTKCNADNSTPIGPCLVAAKAIPNPQKLALKTIVNGQALQDGTTAYEPSF